MVVSALPLLIAVGAVTVLVGTRAIIRRAVTEQCCGKCRYPVRGLPTPACPECGSDLREVGILIPERASERIVGLRQFAMLALVILAGVWSFQARRFVMTDFIRQHATFEFRRQSNVITINCIATARSGIGKDPTTMTVLFPTIEARFGVGEGDSGDDAGPMRRFEQFEARRFENVARVPLDETDMANWLRSIEWGETAASDAERIVERMREYVNLTEFRGSYLHSSGSSTSGRGSLRASRRMFNITTLWIGAVWLVVFWLFWLLWRRREMRFVGRTNMADMTLAHLLAWTGFCFMGCGMVLSVVHFTFTTLTASSSIGQLIAIVFWIAILVIRINQAFRHADRERSEHARPMP